MTVWFVTDPDFADHDAGRRHPERPERLTAVLEGAEDASVREALVWLPPRAATFEEVAAVHGYAEDLQRFCASGGGAIDADTAAVPASWHAALLAAGAGLSAAEQLRTHGGAAAFCAVRPPGHHATPSRAMGFCLFNNVAVTAAALRARGERVAVVDFDAHHGNGTQDCFYDDAGVFYVSLHQSPLYPGTGDAQEVGTGEGRGTTLNLPVPPGTTGDTYLQAVEEVIGPELDRFDPHWLLLSAGFDAHRADPLTDMGLTSGDYALLTARLAGLAPASRLIAFLEGGYDLAALRDSTAACLAALEGEIFSPEASTAGGPGYAEIAAAVATRRRVLAG